MIDSLIRQDRSFAIYRLPGEDTPRFLMQTSGSVRLLYNIEELNGQSGFVIAPFRVTKECPIVLIRPDSTEIPSCPEEVKCLPKETATSPERNYGPADYSRCFSIFIEALQSGRMDKLVLSRSQMLKKEFDFSPAQAFYAACKRYTRSYVYLCHTPETGTWLGGTPEILLSGQAGRWHTVALAGTQPLQQDRLPEIWDDKNRREQQLVASYIRTQLSSLGIRPEEEGPYATRAGELSHLKSDFRFSLPGNNKLGDLLKLLHPTPAVCGLPKEEAYRFILTNEGYDRRYYSGFIGWLNPDAQSDLYVNLRCMQIQEQTLTLYAGGGLLPSSQLDDEWQETEDKMQTMQRLINPSLKESH